MTRATAAGNATAKPRVYRHRALSRLDSGETTRALRRNLNSAWSPLVPADQRIAVSSRPQIAALLPGGKSGSATPGRPQLRVGREAALAVVGGPRTIETFGASARWTSSSCSSCPCSPGPGCSRQHRSAPPRRWRSRASRRFRSASWSSSTTRQRASRDGAGRLVRGRRAIAAPAAAPTAAPVSSAGRRRSHRRERPGTSARRCCAADRRPAWSSRRRRSGRSSAAAPTGRR
jgi:hypothetical protein